MSGFVKFWECGLNPVTLWKPCAVKTPEERKRKRLENQARYAKK